MLKRIVTLAVATIALTTGVAGAQSSQSPQPAQTPAGSAVQVDASSIIGSTVRGTDGKDIGKVSRLMVDPREGRIKSVVISVGGVLGVGGRSVSVPWESVKVGQDNQRMVVTVEQQLLDSAPAASPASEERGRSTR